ncbi:hypothetical protein BHM03_00049483 [Ensete ventricosum]|nr:hypothetical protein BHM03_00049483 [Ensete ventricosum]
MFERGDITSGPKPPKVKKGFIPSPRPETSPLLCIPNLTQQVQTFTNMMQTFTPLLPQLTQLTTSMQRLALGLSTAPLLSKAKLESSHLTFQGSLQLREMSDPALHLLVVECSFLSSRVRALLESKAQSDDSWEPLMKAQLQAMVQKLDKVQQGPCNNLDKHSRGIPRAPTMACNGSLAPLLWCVVSTSAVPSGFSRASARPPLLS